MANDLTEKYFVKNTQEGSFADVTQMFDGLRVLKAEGFLSKGEPVNIFTQQWVGSDTEDFIVTKVNDEEGTPIVIRKNVDIEITFIVHQKYASMSIDVMQVHDDFIGYMTGSDVWFKTSYAGLKTAHCVCLTEYKPTTVKLCRGDASWVMGTLKLHCLEPTSE